MAYVKTTWVTGSTPLSATNMNHIEDGIFAAHQLIAELWKSIYPVGCYFETSDSNFNPNVAFGGTWILETPGQVHVSAGSGYAVSGALNNTSDGGSKDAIIPYHNHSIAALSGTAASAGAHSHTVTGSSGSAGAHSHGTSSGYNFSIYSGTRSTETVGGIGGSGYKMTQVASSGAWSGASATASAGAHTHTISVSCASAGAHTHTVSIAAHDTTYVGSSGNITNANMMPHINVYRWHRTA